MPVRKEKQLLADSRALEEQSERLNPLSGRGGATPSMGLSQVRGGAMHREVGGYDSGRYEGQGKPLLKNTPDVGSKVANALWEFVPEPFHWIVDGIDSLTGNGKMENKDEFMKHVLKYKGFKAKKGSKKSEPTKPTAEMEGCGKKRPAGKRAELVKKVMKDKGLSLPAASKYVKDNNLYTK